VYNRVTKETGENDGKAFEDRPQARAMVLSKKMNNTSTAGFGSFRETFHTTMLIDSILRVVTPPD